MEERAHPHALDAEFEEIGEQRRGERRKSDRRATRDRLDPLFAATLVNQIAEPETTCMHSYAAPTLTPRRGIVVNLKA